MKWLRSLGSLFKAPPQLTDEQLNASGNKHRSSSGNSNILYFDGAERRPDGSLVMLLDLSKYITSQDLEIKMLEALEAIQQNPDVKSRINLPIGSWGVMERVMAATVESHKSALQRITFVVHPDETKIPNRAMDGKDEPE